MDIIFNGYQNTVHEFDDALIQAGMFLNQAVWEYEGFIREILSRFPSGELLCSIDIPVLGSEGFLIDAVSTIKKNDDGAVIVSLEQSGDMLWDGIAVSAQDYICQNIFMEIKKYDITRSLFSSSGS